MKWAESIARRAGRGAGRGQHFSSSFIAPKSEVLGIASALFSRGALVGFESPCQARDSWIAAICNPDDGMSPGQVSFVDSGSSHGNIGPWQARLPGQELDGMP